MQFRFYAPINLIDCLIQYDLLYKSPRSVIVTFNGLYYIVVVAQEHKLRRAAERFFINQPVLSLATQKSGAELGEL